MVGAARVALDWCWSGGVLMMSVEIKETPEAPVPLDDVGERWSGLVPQICQYLK